jgi:hypothetical protein
MYYGSHDCGLASPSLAIREERGFMSSEMSSLRKAAFGADFSISAAPPLFRP